MMRNQRAALALSLLVVLPGCGAVVLKAQQPSTSAPGIHDSDSARRVLALPKTTPQAAQATAVVKGAGTYTDLYFGNFVAFTVNAQDGVDGPSGKITVTVTKFNGVKTTYVGNLGPGAYFYTNCTDQANIQTLPTIVDKKAGTSYTINAAFYEPNGVYFNIVDDGGHEQYFTLYNPQPLSTGKVDVSCPGI